VFGERPNVNYELNDVRSALEWHRQSSLYTNTSPASTSSYCSCTSQMSSPDSSLYQTPKGSRMKLRPLPPIPVVERAISTTSSPATYQVEPDYDKPTSQEKLDERMTNVLKTRKKTVTVTKSLPTMHRTHSVPFLADDDNSLGQTRPARLSSQSLEDVSQQLASSSEDDLDDSPWTQPAEISDGATSSIKIIRPPLPPKPSAEQIVNAFRSKGSMLRRQRPVARSRGGIDAYRSLQFNQQTYTVSTQSESSVLATVSIKRHSAEMYDENIYEQIKSPIYCDMSSLSRRTSPRSGESTNTFCWQPKAAGIATVVTSSLANDESIYECYQPRLQPADSELYVNVDALRNAASNNSTICTPTTLTVSDSRSGIVKPLIRHVNSGLNDSEGIYCSPISQSLTGDKTIEHDVPDAVTRSSQNGAPVISDRQLDSATGSESGDRELRWLSIDEIPTDVTSFTVDDVASCLRLLNLGGYVALFRREQIDGDLLTSLDKDVLMEDFGFKRFDAIKLEKFVRHGWRPKLV
jgi:hypothetical protein